MKRADNAGALQQARRFARSRNMDMLQLWLERASVSRPLSDLQVHRFKHALTASEFARLDFSKIHTRTFNYTEVEL